MSHRLKAGKAAKTAALAGLFAASAALVCSAQANADPVSTSASGFETPYGRYRGAEHRPFDPSTRSANGNRVVINGRMLLGEDASTLPPGLARDVYGTSGLAQAVGNQLNVVVEGDNNTVIVDSTQTNNGDVEANVVLNGELDLDD